MSSGVAVSEAVVSLFEEMKIRHKTRYFIASINIDAGEIVIEKEVPMDDKDAKETYNSFLEELPEKEGRYAVYDFSYELKDGGQRSKLIFYVWAPDSAPIKQKMLYASSKDALKKKLTGIAHEVQGTDMDEVEFDKVYDDVSAGGTK